MLKKRKGRKPDYQELANQALVRRLDRAQVLDVRWAALVQKLKDRLLQIVEDPGSEDRDVIMAGRVVFDAAYRVCPEVMVEVMSKGIGSRFTSAAAVLGEGEREVKEGELVAVDRGVN